jgi:hypothetical protein
VATSVSTVHYVVKSATGTEYVVDRESDHLWTVRWTSGGRPAVRYARTFKAAKKVASDLADFSNTLRRRTRVVG